MYEICNQELNTELSSDFLFLTFLYSSSNYSALCIKDNLGNYMDNLNNIENLP